MKRYAKVDFTGPPASCSASVSWPLASTINITNSKEIHVVKIEDENNVRSFVSALTSTNIANANTTSEFVIKVNGNFGQLLSLKDGQSVLVTEIEHEIPSVESIDVRCESPDDWEILEANAEAVTNKLLNQLRIVYTGLRFPIWVSKSLSINLCIEKLKPQVEVGILKEFSEVVIPAMVSSKTKSFELNCVPQFRLVPLTRLPSTKLNSNSNLLLNNIDHGYIYRSSLLNRNQDQDDVFYSYSSDNEPISFCAKILYDSESEIKCLNVTIYFVECITQLDKNLTPLFPCLHPPTLFLHPQLIKEHNLSPGSRIFIEQLSNNVFAHSIPRYSPETVTLLQQSNDKNYSRIFQKLFDEGQIFLTIALDLLALQHGICGPPSSSCGLLLITGKEGSGKTTFVQSLASQFQLFPFNLHWDIVSCAKLRGKKTEIIQKKLDSVSKRAIDLGPSLIIFDDLDIICPPIISEQQNAQEEFLHYRTSEAIFECIRSLIGNQDQNQLAVICTAKMESSLNKYWRSREGSYIFQHHIHLPAPNPLERLDLFRACLHRYQSFQENRPKIDLTDTMETILSNLHDSVCTANLLDNIAKKWAIASVGALDRDGLFSEIIRNQFGLNDGATKSKAASLTWDQIGGLSTVKNELTKIIQWPIKYSKLFAVSPIKMPSGILLYGYPGTGKTLMGMSVTSLVKNTKFIHVKGPELLSKYIGASEQAVQDLFRKAKDSSPCILFFDEFDSLVPRRGHDSTGVTDRVVNQFLAEMDGIEGGLGKGVYLIGATSRPDLIDPAVLRPGRLDKHLFFNIPDYEERLEIISALSVDVQFEESESKSDGNIHWDDIARETEGFTGADLYSLLCTAQMDAIQESLAHLLNSCKVSEDASMNIENLKNSSDVSPEVFVTQKHISNALKTFKPSLPASEFKKFKTIYDNFSSITEDEGGKSGVKTSRVLIEHGKKATLA